jgi:hypothetical protein
MTAVGVDEVTQRPVLTAEQTRRQRTEKRVPCQHFLDVTDALGVPHPVCTTHDPAGNNRPW